MTDHNSWTWNQKLRDLCFLYSLFLIRLVGLWPYTIELRGRPKEFKTAWFWRLQPILTGTIFLTSFVVFFRGLLPSVKRQWKSDAANMLMMFFGILNTVSLITTYLTVYLKITKIKSILVRSQEFKYKSQRLLTDDKNRSASAILLYLFKAIIILLCFIVVVYGKILLANLPMPGFVLPFLVVPVVINNTVPILFFGVILLAKIYFERINTKIAEIMRMANVLTLQKQNQRMHRYCELSDLLDELAILHMELTLLTQDMCKVCNLHMTIYMSWLTVNAILQKFFVYMCVSNWLKDFHILGSRFPMELCVIGVLTIILIWTDLIMFGQLCFTIAREAQKSLQILQEQILITDVDIRFRRSVELFSMQISHHKFDIKASGMYNIDYSLLYAIASSTISYLLIMIQVELAVPVTLAWRYRYTLPSDISISSFSETYPCVSRAGINYMARYLRKRHYGSTPFCICDGIQDYEGFSCFVF